MIGYRVISYKIKPDWSVLEENRQIKEKYLLFGKDNIR